MKSMKKIRSGLIGLGLVIPVASVAGVVASCGKKEAPSSKTSFDAFKIAAEAESAVNIVTQITPKGWDSLPKNDLTKGTYPQVVGQTVVVSIMSKKKEQTAIFSAVYKANTTYNINAWTCIAPAAPTVSWADFKKSAEGDSQDVNAIFQTIKTANPTGINIDLNSIESTSLVIDENSKFSDDSNIVTLVLVLKSPPSAVGDSVAVTTTINFEIHFHNVAYDVKNWTAPSYTFDDFTTDAKASVATDSWKAYAKTQIHDASNKNWATANCSFGKITVNASTQTLTVGVTNITNDQSAIATLKFHSVNKKVWIYGEQMGVAKSAGAWSFGAPIIDKWAKFQSNVKAWAKNDDNQILNTLKYFQNNDTKPGFIPFKDKWTTHLNKPGTTDVWQAITTKSTNDDTHQMFYTIFLKSSDDALAKLISLNISITYNNSGDLIFKNSNCKMLKWSDWSVNAIEYISKAYNDKDDNLSDNIINAISAIAKADKTKFPNMTTLLKTHRTPTLATTLKFKIDLGSFKFVADTGHNGLTYGSETFTIVFYDKSDTTNSKPLTSGGLFYLDRFDASHKAGPGYEQCGIDSDITIKK